MMDDARFEATSSFTSIGMDDVRDEAHSSVTLYEKNKNKLETANDRKDKRFEGGVSSVDSMVGCRVSDRKKFFEHHIIEQKQRENALVSPTQPNCKPSSSSRNKSEEILHPYTKVETTDSESLFRKKSVILGRESIHFGSSLDNTDGRIGPEPFSGSSFPTSEFDTPNYSLEKLDDLKRKHISTNHLCSTAPTVDLPVSNGRDYVEKAESLDHKILSLTETNADNFQLEGREDKDSEYACVSESERIRRNENSNWSSPIPSNDDASPTNDAKNIGAGCPEADGTGSKDIEDELISVENRPIVKIKVTNTRNENQNNDENCDIEDRWHQDTDIGEIVTEFQQVSEQLSKSFMKNTSPNNFLTTDQSSDRTKPAEIDQDHQTNLHGSYLAQNTLTVNDFNDMAEKYQAANLTDKNTDNNYIYPSESTDCSIDSKGNSKGAKSVSSKSAKSAKSSKKLKARSSGMGKILKKAKKGMGKSVKNLTKSVSQISHLTSIVKNTRKTKLTRASTMEESRDITDGNLDLKNSLVYHDIFDAKLADELVTNNKSETSIYTARRYIDVGKRLLQSGAELDKTNDLQGSKEAIRKAHTYAYVGRQYAKEYLVTYREEHLEETKTSRANGIAGVSDDAITAFEYLLLSILQCDGPCSGNYSTQSSKVQIDEAIEILNKLSETEAAVVKTVLSAESSEIGRDRRKKVEEALKNAHRSNVGDDKRRDKKADHDINLAVNSFISDLRSFYEIDTTLKLSQIFLDLNEGEKEDGSDTRSLLSESESYNYSESLKYDHGRSHHTSSDTAVGSSKEEELSTSSLSSRDQKIKEESLAQGIRPGTTVVSISVKNKHFKNKNNGFSNKKRQPSPKRWLAVGTRKQK